MAPQDSALWNGPSLNLYDGRSTALAPHIAAVSGFSSASAYYAGAGPNGSSTMTIGALVRCVRGGVGTIAGKHNGSSKGYALAFSGQNEVVFTAYNGSGARKSSPAKELQERSFHSLVGVLDGTAARLYVDGAEVEGDADQISTFSAYTTGSFGVGARGTGAQGATGLFVAGVAVLGSTALDALEVSRWHEAIVDARAMVAPPAATPDALWSMATETSAPASWVDSAGGASLTKVGSLARDIYTPRIAGVLLGEG